MKQNLFEELQQKKQRLLTLTNKAREYGWIDTARETEIKNKINNDLLTIGVIGQMKCGKSTFLNAFVFEDDVLPSATTPMTAALSVITYGEEKKIVAEFYSDDEWAEQKMQAARSLDEVAGNVLEESKIKAAKELVGKAGQLGSSLNGYLGKTQSDSFENLIKYVGADGKYISITKSVTIYYPKEYLKGVEIVDTPGFNDPIVSREERTKAFLQKADVVLMMLYAGRPFDATDREILFKNVAQCGTGKVLIGINKYDIPYEKGDMESEIKEYVKEQLRRACKEYGDNLMIEILKDTEPIPVSAEMALLSELPMGKITSAEAYHHAWNRACGIFEISNQQQMRTKSYIDNLIAAVKKVVETEKEAILFRKPMNAIIASGNKKKNDVEKDIQECSLLLAMLNEPDDEREERQEKLRKADRRLNKKIDLLSDDIETSLRDIVRRGRNQLEDDVDSACAKMDNIIDGLGRFQSAENILPKLDRVIQELITRTLKRDVQKIAGETKGKIRDNVTDFLDEVDDILMHFVKDFDSRDFVKGFSKEIDLQIEDKELFNYESGHEDDDYGITDFLSDILNGATYGLLGGVTNFITYGDNKRQLHENVNEIRNVDVSEFLVSIYIRKEEIINKVRTRIIDELVKPMQEQLEEICQKTQDKEKQLEDAKNKLTRLQEQKNNLVKQIEEMETYQ